MKATVEQQQALLALQEVDSQLARVKHRIASRPLAGKVRELSDQLADIQRELVGVQTNSDDLQRAVNRSEDELDRVRKRLQRDRELADQGASARVQRELEHELSSLSRRISDLEDAELEMLSQQEDLVAKVNRLQELDVQLREELDRSRAQQQEESDVASQELAELTAQRSQMADGIAGELLRRYETIRADTPIAVALLAGSQCGGCRLELPPLEVTQLRSAPEDELLTCDECGCLLIRG